MEKSFLAEWNERAGFVTAIAVFNPVVVTLYVLFMHRSGGALEFWLIGLGLTFIVCVIAGSFMLMVILADRRKRARDRRKQAMWEAALPYDPRKAKTAETPSEAG